MSTTTMKNTLPTLLAFALAATAALASPGTIDSTRPDLPYNPALYDKDGRMIRFDRTPPAWKRAPFTAPATEFVVSRVGQKETRESLLAIYEAIAKGKGYDELARKVVPAAEGTTELTQAAFVEALKAGQTFEVTIIEARRCPACHGEGVLRPRVEHGENRDTPRKDWKKCPWDGATAGQADFAVSYTVKW